MGFLFTVNEAYETRKRRDNSGHNRENNSEESHEGNVVESNHGGKINYQLK